MKGYFRIILVIAVVVILIVIGIHIFPAYRILSHIVNNSEKCLFMHEYYKECLQSALFTGRLRDNYQISFWLPYKINQYEEGTQIELIYDVFVLDHGIKHRNGNIGVIIASLSDQTIVVSALPYKGWSNHKAVEMIKYAIEELGQQTE